MPASVRCKISYHYGEQNNQGFQIQMGVGLGLIRGEENMDEWKDDRKDE